MTCDTASPSRTAFDSSRSRPEDFLQRPPADPELYVDAIDVALNRALAILELVQCDGEDLSEGFAMNHETILTAIWAAEGMVREAKTILSYATAKEMQS